MPTHPSLIQFPKRFFWFLAVRNGHHYDLLFPGTSFWLYMQPTFGKHSIQPRKCYNPFTCQIENRGFLGQMEEIRTLCSDHQCPWHHPSIKMNSYVIVIEMEAGNALLLALSYQHCLSVQLAQGLDDYVASWETFSEQEWGLELYIPGSAVQWSSSAPALSYTVNSQTIVLGIFLKRGPLEVFLVLPCNHSTCHLSKKKRKEKKRRSPGSAQLMELIV